MSNGPELSGFEDPWALGSELIANARGLNEYVAKRQPGLTTQRKIARKLSGMTNAYVAQNILIDTSLSLLPVEEGIVVDQCRTTGVIIGFAWDKHPTIPDTLGEGTAQYGLIMYVATANLNLTSAESADAWRLNVVSASGMDPTGIEGIVIGVPVTEELKARKFEITESPSTNEGA